MRQVRSRSPGLLLLLLASVLLYGCAQREADGQEDYSDLVHYETGTLQGRVQVVDVIEQWHNDVLQVQVTVENPSAFRTDYQYKFRWFNAEGMEVAAEGEPWKPRELAARSRDHLQGVAPNPSVKRFELRVR